MDKRRRNPPSFSAVLAAVLYLLSSSAGASDTLEDPKIRPVTGLADNRRVGATERRFQAFMRRYGKEYGSREEYGHRLGVFARNLARAAEHQVLDPTAVHGITPFSDLTEEEFERAFMGIAAKDDKGGVSMEYPTAPRMEVDGLPSSFDWRKKGAVTDVKVQVRTNDLSLDFNLGESGIWVADIGWSASTPVSVLYNTVLLRSNNTTSVESQKVVNHTSF